MPTVGIKRDLLVKALGVEYTQKEFEELFFDFGLELDDVTTEGDIAQETGGAAAATANAGREVYKIDIPANRYDLLCLEGLCRGINTFLKKKETVKYSLAEPEGAMQEVHVTANTQKVRPFVVAAILRDVTLDQDKYDSFIDLQEKLHHNICRRRTLVAIGTHDLDNIEGPFKYDAMAPKDIKFRPLRAPDATKEYTADELMKAYESDLQLKQFLHILQDEPLYPVVLDKNNTVLSMPPIINGHHSRITTKTRNIFIECTATDLTKAKIVLNMIVCMFSEYCAKPFTIEPVKVINADKTETIYPALETRTETVDPATINKRIGINLEGAKFAELLGRMQLPTVLNAKGMLEVQVGPGRPDILHECDIWEDAAISFGFNNIERAEPKVVTLASQLPINKLTDALRHEICAAGFNEALTFALCSLEDGFDSLRRADDGKTAVVIANPKTQDFQIGRVNLLSGLLKTVACNTSMSMPIKVFEISDVMLLDPTAESGAKNVRRLGAVVYSKSAGFEAIQGLLDYVLMQLQVPYLENPSDRGTKYGYYQQPTQDPAFFSKLGAADIIVGGKRVGVFGVVHPEVLANYGLRCPCSALEIDLAPFL